MSSRTLGVIPARLASTRLPRKVLREIAGRPLLAWVVEAARACPQLDSVIVAADSEDVVDLCHRLDVPVQLTSPELPSGSDRVHAVAQLFDADIYVNIQGDEPFFRPEHITAILRPFAQAQSTSRRLKSSALRRTSTIPTQSKLLPPPTAARCTSPAPPFPTIATARTRNTGSTSASTRIARRRSTAFPPCPPACWSKRNASNSFAISRTACISTSKRLSSTPSASTLKPTCSSPRRFFSSNR